MTNAVIEPPPSFARWREARGVTERGKARKRFFHISSAPHTSRVPLSGKRLAFIGGGTMAEAMIRGLLDKHLVPPSHVLVTGPRRERRAELAKAYGVKALASNAEAATDAHVVVLSVKPQVLATVMRELRGKLDEEKLVLSIVAGATLRWLRDGLEHAAIGRAMPNTPSQVGMGR